MLLCGVHVHTTYSDGVLTLRQVVDLFGQSGHGAIAITDHIVNRDNGLGKIAHALRRSLDPENWKRYREEIEAEAARAWQAYGMVVLPGAELTRNTINRDTSVHVLAIGLEGFLPADGDPLEMLREIRSRGAVSHRLRRGAPNGRRGPGTLGPPHGGRGRRALAAGQRDPAACLPAARLP